MAQESPPETTNSRNVNVLAVCMFGLCPRCSTGKIFQNILGLKPACPDCGLDLEPYQQADGPAFFVILFAGAIMTPIALWLYRLLPSWPLYIAVIGALTLVLVLIMLRLAKGLLLASQYKTGAREGELDTPAP